MARCLILFPNRGDAATLSGGAWQIGLPNLQNRIIQKVARTVSLDLADTQFAIDLDRSRATRAVSLINAGVSPSALQRLRFYALNGTQLAQTGSEATDGWEPIFPRQKPTAQMRWSDTNFWSGRPTSEDLRDTTLSAITVLDQEYFASRITVEIDDRSNPIPYLDFGRLFVAGQYQPSHNYAYGAGLQFDARSTSARSRGGTLYHNKRRSPRVKTITFENLPEAEAYSTFYELQRRANTTEELFYIENPDDVVNRQRTSFLARQRSLPAIVQNAFLRCDVAFEIEEII